LIGARRHVAGTSATLALSDAETLHAAGDYRAAANRAMKSLAYSVGVFHPDYARCGA